MSKPLISVIIPVYNREEFVEEAIQSILDQTIQDFEIIIVDDCSTDESLKVINGIEDNRIKLLVNKIHKGVSVSRNIALNYASGKYIAFMDSDDISRSNRFEKQICYLESNPDVKACGCWLQCFGKHNHIIKHKANHEEIKAELILRNPMSLGATTVVRESFKDYRFKKEKLHVEDYDYWVQVAWDCKLANLQEVLYDYRTHKKQVSTEFLEIQREQDIDIKFQLLRKIDEDLVKNNTDKISRVLFLKNARNENDYKKTLKILKLLFKRNIKKNTYDKRELNTVLEKLKSQIIYEIFFINSNKLQFSQRLSIFSTLNLSDQLAIIKRKL